MWCEASEAGENIKDESIATHLPTTTTTLTKQNAHRLEDFTPSSDAGKAIIWTVPYLLEDLVNRAIEGWFCDYEILLIELCLDVMSSIKSSTCVKYIDVHLQYQMCIRVLNSAHKIILSTMERLASRSSRAKAASSASAEKGPGKLLSEGKHMAFIIAVSRLLIRYEDVLVIPAAPAEGQVWKNGLSLKEEDKKEGDKGSGIFINAPSFGQTTYWGRWRSSNGFGNPKTSVEDYKQHESERKLFWTYFLGQANRMWSIREKTPAESEQTVGGIFIRFWGVLLQRLPSVARAALVYS